MPESHQIKIYSKGMVFCSVCAPKSLSREEVEKQVNMENPTGIESQWKVSKDKFKNNGENPGQCEQVPDRMHYLMVC